MNAATVFNFAVFLAAAATLVAYLCRLDLLTYRGHLPGVVLMHACFAAAIAFAGGNAAVLDAGPLEVFVVLGSALWIRVSYPSWRGGHVPEHYVSGPVPLDAPNTATPPA